MAAWSAGRTVVRWAALLAGWMGDYAAEMTVGRWVASWALILVG
jgi:hypothetical protein